MIILQKILGVTLKSCLFMDRYFLRIVDWGISSGMSMRFFSDRIQTSRQNIFLKRGIIYSLLLVFVVAVGLYCSESDELGGAKKLSAPSSVSGFKVTGGNALITVSWDATEGASEYKIFMDDDSGKSKLLDMPEQEPGKNSYSKSFSEGLESVGMENGIKYAFQISARNSEGEGAKSDKAYGMPRPDNLGNLGSRAVESSSSPLEVTLSWDIDSLATEYIVSRSTSTGSDGEFGEFSEIATVTCSILSQSCEYIDGSVMFTTYEYKVIAVLVIGDADLESAEVTSLDNDSALATIRLRSLSDRQVSIAQRTKNAMRPLDSDVRITLTITAPTDPSATITRYKIETLTGMGEAIPGVPAFFVAYSETVEQDFDQPYGLGRQYRVTAQMGSGSVHADILDSENTVDVFSILPDAPIVSNFMVSGVTSRKAELSWSKIGRATHYTLKRISGGSTSTTLLTEEVVADLMESGTTYIYRDIHNLGHGQSYTYKLIPIISGVNVEGVQGDVVTQSGATPVAVSADVTQFVDVFTGTQYTHGDSYQPSRVYPLASVPFGMVVFTVANAFHSGNFWYPPNDSAGGRSSGRMLPSYKGQAGTSPYDKIKGFSAFSFQGPGCNLAHDFLMMPTTTGTTIGNKKWLSASANGGGNIHDDYEIKRIHTRRATTAERESVPGDEEWAEPGYYRVTTKSGILIEISATKRTGIMKITYPSTASSGYFNLGAYTRTDRYDDGNSFINPRAISGSDKGLRGQIRAGTFCGEGGDFKYQVFMSGEFDRAYTSPIRRHDGNEMRVKFDTQADKTLIYKFGLSYVSYAGARKNMVGGTGVSGENNTFDFNMIKTQANRDWNNALSKIKVRDSHTGTGSDDGVRTTDKRRLYTYLFRSLLHPNIFSDVDKKYVGFRGDVFGSTNGLENLPSSQKAQYQYFSNWDIYRSQTPLIAFLYKGIGRDMVRSLLNNADQAGNTRLTGGFTRWGVANHDSGVMGGDPATMMISDSSAFGATLSRAEDDRIINVFLRSGKLREVDLHASNSTSCRHRATNGGSCVLTSAVARYYQGGAVTTNVRSSNKTIHSLLINNNPFSKIVELAHADYSRAAFIYRSIAVHGDGRNLSRKTALRNEAVQFRASSQGWTQLFRGGGNSRFKSRTVKKYAIHGANRCYWFGGSHGCFHEGTNTQYEWSFPYDMTGRFTEGNENNTVVGGFVSNTKVLNKLNTHFSAHNLVSQETGTRYNAGNQVGFGTPYVYHYIGRPNKTLEVVRKKLAKYWPDAFRAYPGNEDGGSMSAQFVWSFVGLYPHTHGSDRLLLLYPAFDYVEFDLSDGLSAKKLILKRDPTSNVPSSTNNACVEKVTADGIDTDLTSGTNIQNGVNWTKSYIHYRNISSLTTLSFKIVRLPSNNVCTTVWGRKMGDIPPSSTEQ